VTNWVPGADNPPRVDGGGDTAWNAGQLFNQDDSWVSTSNDANGVAGDTIQGGEVLDFNLVRGNNPTGTLADPANYAQASAMFLKFDGIGSGEDMIVILKLYDPNTDTYTTRAIMVENGDIQKGPGAGPGQYSGVTLDNNDGLVIIESNDYNLPGENWVIVGAQIAGSDEGVTGTAINLNSAIGAAGDSDVDNNGSLDTDALGFQSDTNDGPFKISSIGFLTTQTTPQDAHLDFDVTVTDGDGDSITQAIAVDVTAAADSSTPIVLGGGVTTIQSVGGESATSSFSNLSYENDNQKWHGNGNDKNFSLNNTGIVAGIVAAAGLQSVSAAGSPSIEQSFDLDLQGLSNTILPQYSLQQIDDGALNVQSFGVEQSEPAFDLSALQGSGHGFNDFVSNGGLDVQAYGDAVPAYEPSFALDQAPAFDASVLVAVAPTVGMPSAEALVAAGLAGNAQHGGAVEQIVAEALGNAAPTVDALLEAVNGNGQQAILEALSNVPDGGAGGDMSAILNGTSGLGVGVSSWDMSSHGAFGATADMMFKMDVASFHQDAVQPAVNG
jgi:hypothetical protein